MGIKGLWQALKPYVQDGHLGQFRGQRVAVDMYVWLHTATRGCIIINEERLAEYFMNKQQHQHQSGGGGAFTTVGGGNSTSTATAAASPVVGIAIEEVATLSDQYIEKLVGRVESLQRFGIIPVCVFDGTDIPMKAGTNEARGQRRQEWFTEALARLEDNYARSGGCRGFQRHAASYREGLELLEKALDISTEVAHPVIQVLREERHLECIVAPYEADAQLTHLAQTGYVQAAMSEDSDLIAYYCPCVIAKVDFYSGRCDVILPGKCVPVFFRSMAAAAAAGGGGGGGAGGKRKGSSSSGITTISAPPQAAGGTGDPTTTTVAAPGPAAFTYESFLLGCVMSGCDYVANLSKIGVKTAFKLVSHAHSLPQLLALLQTQFGFPAETVRIYRRGILEAFYCFAHHIVYCPRSRKVVNLHPLPAAMAGGGQLKTALVGELWSDEVARKVCEECLYDPETHALYRGTNMAALRSYLQRTRRGQASLTSFQGFKGITAAKVIGGGGGGGVKRERDSGGSGGRGADAAASHLSSARPRHDSSLRKVQEASGFLGSSGSGGGGERVVVRSKYFLRPNGRLGVQEDWSACSSSDNDDDNKERDGKDGFDAEYRTSSSSGGPGAVAAPLNGGGVAAALAPGTARGLSTPALSELTLGPESASPPTSSDATHDSSPADSNGNSRHHPLRQEHRPRDVFDTLGYGAAPSPTVSTANTTNTTNGSSSSSGSGSSSRPAPCCPFGYSQCGAAHSIFVKCFEGMGWTRGGEAAPSSVSVSGSGLTAATAAAATAPVQATTASTTTVVGGTRDDQEPSRPGKRQQQNGAYPSSLTFQCGGFRPPRNLGHTVTRSSGGNTTSSSSSNSEDLPARAANPTSSAASIFDSLAFKKK